MWRQVTLISISDFDIRHAVSAAVQIFFKRKKFESDAQNMPKRNSKQQRLF